MKYHTKLTFKIYWQHVKQYKVSGLVLVFSLALASTAAVISPYYYKQFIDSAIAGGTKGELLSILWIILAVYLLEWVCWRTAGFVNSYFQTSLMRDLADTCFAFLHKHSFNFFQSNFVGSLVKRVNRFYRSFETVADIFTWDLLPITVNVTLITIVLWNRSPLIGGILLAWIILYGIINYFFTRYKLPYDVERSRMDSKVTGILADTITNHSNVKLLTGYGRERKYFGGETRKLNSLRRFTWDLATGFEAVQAFLMIALEIGALYLAITLWQKGVLTIGDFVLIQTYLLRVFLKIWDLGRIIRRLYESLADAEEMAQIFDTPHEIVDAKRAKILSVGSGEIVFDRVGFFYHKTRKIIKNLNLTIAAGERVALVGPSGAGKSTIIKLLLRQHDVTAGKVFIDGQPIHKVTLESLWKNISLVPQDPILFHRTLIENIRYGRPSASDEEVIRAAKLANCHEFIRELQDGYNTFVGERGIKLSGGERQRVAIARAILRNAPILILDEATSSLDSESERLIQEALENLMKKKTVIVVAHRLSTIMQMDRILVIQGGDVIEEGTHQELLKMKKGLYKRLWDVQAGGFIA